MQSESDFFDCQILDWDSDFYGFKVGEIKSNEETLEECLKNLINRKVKLIYAFLRTEIQNNNLLENYNGKLVDTKLIFEKNVKRTVLDKKYLINVDEFKEKKPTKDLYKLAVLSGHTSRFKKDEKFPSGSFVKLYKLWIDKSISGILSDKVFVYKEQNKVLGFITIKIRNQVGQIGLIAVDEKYQGKSIGQKLVLKVESYMLSENIRTLRVATQKDNFNAIKFYTKNSFHLIDSTIIYHFWTK